MRPVPIPSAKLDDYIIQAGATDRLGERVYYIITTKDIMTRSTYLHFTQSTHRSELSEPKTRWTEGSRVHGLVVVIQVSDVNQD